MKGLKIKSFTAGTQRRSGNPMERKGACSERAEEKWMSRQTKAIDWTAMAPNSSQLLCRIHLGFSAIPLRLCASAVI
jgi:hypothetical protein